MLVKRLLMVSVACAMLLFGVISPAMADAASGNAINGLVLVGDLPKDAELADEKSDDEGNYYQELATSDGAFIIATFRQKVNDDYPMEMPLPDFLQKALALEEVPEMEAVPVEPVAAYPADRVRFQLGENEDTSIEDVVVIRTDEYYFIFLAHTSADIYYGYTDGFEEDDAAQIIDAWVESLDLFDSGETTGGE